MNDNSKSPGLLGVPPPQHNLQRATNLALQNLQDQSNQQIQWLGANLVDQNWQLPVFDSTLSVNVSSGKVTTPEGKDVSAMWRIMVLHYLGVKNKPEHGTAEITFADLPSGRAYAGVYQGRVIGRLCSTAGRDIDILRKAAIKIGAQIAEGGDAAFDFTIFPRIPVRLIWYTGDEEFGPSATLLLNSNIESFFHIEDIVVLSEGIVSYLSGSPF